MLFNKTIKLLYESIKTFIQKLIVDIKYCKNRIKKEEERKEKEDDNICNIINK